MKLSRFSLLPLCGLALFAGAAAPGSDGLFRPLISPDSKNCYMDAVSDAGRNHYQPALAKLESLLMLAPVTVGIDETTFRSSIQGYRTSVANGVGIWRDNLKDSPFVGAGSGKGRPDVLVKFVKDMDAQGADLQGMIEAEHEFKWSGDRHTSKLTGTMYVVYRTGDRNLSQTEATEVVAHELGHLLGLTDAYSAKGLMGPFIPGEPRLTPSGEELAAVNQFRQVVRDEIANIQEKL